MTDPSEIARKIANGHANGKHWQKGEFENPYLGPRLDLKTKDSFQNHIEKTLRDKDTKCFTNLKGQDVYYNGRTNTYVFVNPKSKDMGTCYRDCTPSAQVGQLGRVIN